MAALIADSQLPENYHLGSISNHLKFMNRLKSCKLQKDPV